MLCSKSTIKSTVRIPMSDNVATPTKVSNYQIFTFIPSSGLVNASLKTALAVREGVVISLKRHWKLKGYRDDNWANSKVFTHREEVLII